LSAWWWGVGGAGVAQRGRRPSDHGGAGGEGGACPRGLVLGARGPVWGPRAAGTCWAVAARLQAEGGAQGVIMSAMRRRSAGLMERGEGRGVSRAATAVDAGRPAREQVLLAWRRGFGGAGVAQRGRRWGDHGGAGGEGVLVREGWSLGREGGGGAAGSGGRCAELGRVSDAAWLGLRSGVKALRGRAQPMVPGLRPELRPREPPGLPRFQATLYAEAIGGRTLMGSRGESLGSRFLAFVMAEMVV
jgi:hypothetical protein